MTTSDSHRTSYTQNLFKSISSDSNFWPCSTLTAVSDCGLITFSTLTPDLYSDPWKRLTSTQTPKLKKYGSNSRLKIRFLSVFDFDSNSGSESEKITAPFDFNYWLLNISYIIDKGETWVSNQFRVICDTAKVAHLLSCPFLMLRQLENFIFWNYALQISSCKFDVTCGFFLHFTNY